MASGTASDHCAFRDVAPTRMRTKPRDLFAREAARGDAAADVHFQLGLAHYRLGDIERAARELSRAAEASASRAARDLYSSKLAWLRAQHAR